MLCKGQFSKKMMTFCLQDAIDEVIGIMKMSADLKGIQLFYDEKKEEEFHPLSKVAYDKLPVNVIGYMQRF